MSHPTPQSPIAQLFRFRHHHKLSSFRLAPTDDPIIAVPSGLEQSVYTAPTSILVNTTTTPINTVDTSSTITPTKKRVSVKFAEPSISRSPATTTLASAQKSPRVRSRISRRSSIRADSIDSVPLSSFSASSSSSDEMYFHSSTRPSLTPLGWRLISLSEQKLYDIDASPIGARESGSALRRGVLVREAVKSAWRSVEDGQKGEMNDWHAHNAMGLDVIGENEEEEEEEGQQEERWFEDLLSSLGEEEVRVEQRAEWAVSEVQGVDDEVYDVEDMEAYTIPLPPSPTVMPKSPVLSTSLISTSPTPVDRFVAPQMAVAHTTVDIVSVDDLEDFSDSPFTSFDSFDSSSSFSPVSSVSAISSGTDALTNTTSTSSLPSLSLSASISASLSPLSIPLTPISPITPIDRAITASSTGFTYASFPGVSVPIPDLSELELECAYEYADDLLLPPPLCRSWSSTSTSTCGSNEDDECHTPDFGPMGLMGDADADRYEEDVCEGFEVGYKEVGAGWWLGVGKGVNGAGGESALDDDECGLVFG